MIKGKRNQLANVVNRMKVYELIEALRKMPQDAGITIYAGYDIEYGTYYKDVDSVEQESVGWNDINDEPIVEVYIL